MTLLNWAAILERARGIVEGYEAREREQLL
jgi:hypothetical protein